MNDQDKILSILENELKVAFGCTEPIAVSYCAAVARKHTKGNIKKILCEASTNIIKNAAAVVIPNTGGCCGVALAAAVGAVGGDSEVGLEVLSKISKNDVITAVKLCEENIVTAIAADVSIPLYIKVSIETEYDNVVCIIEESHTKIVYLEKNGVEVLRDNESVNCNKSNVVDEYYDMLSLDTILDFALNTPIEKLDIIKKAIEINMSISREGLKNSYGIQVGKTLKEKVEQGFYGDDLCNNAIMWTAAGSDARMAGCSLPAMSNSGSGNQGITCTVPVAATADYLNKDEETKIRAVTISNLCTIYIKSYLPKLSAVCGAIGAGAGAGCGVVHLLGGGREHMESVIKNVLGDLAGMFCDGAKGSCGLKVSTCINVAIHSAILALDGMAISHTDGLVGHCENETIKNYAKISNDGMRSIDNVILDIILNK